MAARLFDANTARTPSLFNSTTWFYGWDNSQPVPDKDFKVLYDDLVTAFKGGYTAGSVAFAGSTGQLTQDNSNLFYDNTLNYLGIGTNAPGAPLHVVGHVFLRKAGGSTRNVSINSSGNNTSADVIGINVAAGVGASGTNMFVANVAASGAGAHTASNSITIGNGGLAKSNSIQMLGDSIGTNAVVIGRSSTTSGGSNGTSDPATVVGYNNTVGGTGGQQQGTGNVVFGFNNIVGANRNASVGGNTAIAIGSGITLRQSMTTQVAGFQKIIIGVGISDTQESATEGSFGFGHSTYTSLYNTTRKNELFGGLLMTTSGLDASATNTKYHPSGTAPTTVPADSYAQYAKDIVAGNAAPHFRTEAGNIIKLYSETTAVAAAAFVANTSGIADDTATFGGYTIGQIVAALKNHGLLT